MGGAHGGRGPDVGRGYGGQDTSESYGGGRGPDMGGVYGGGRGQDVGRVYGSEWGPGQEPPGPGRRLDPRRR